MELKFSAEVWHWRGPAPFHFLVIPDDQSAEIRGVASGVSYGWGVVPVTAQIGEVRWTTSLIPKQGKYLVPLKDAVRKPLELEIGDLVDCWLEV